MAAQRNYRGDRNYWKHEETGDIYITFGTTREAVNLATGQRQTLALVDLFNFIKLNDETIEQIEPHFNPDYHPQEDKSKSVHEQRQPLRTPRASPLPSLRSNTVADIVKRISQRIGSVLDMGGTDYSEA